MFIAFFSLLIILFGLFISIILVGQSQNIRKYASSNQVSLILPTQMSVKTHELFRVPIMLDTKGISVSAADIVLLFDKSKIMLRDISSRTSEDVFQMFAPISAKGEFDKRSVIESANKTGAIRFSALTYNWQNKTSSKPFNGVLGMGNPLAVLTFRPFISRSSTEIRFNFTPGKTDDTNILQANALTDLLASVNSLQININ